MLVAGPNTHAFHRTFMGKRLSNSSIITISSNSSVSLDCDYYNAAVANDPHKCVDVNKEIKGHNVDKYAYGQERFLNPVYFVQPTRTHRAQYSSSRCSNESNDSLTAEVRHFKPIKASPLTTEKSKGKILMVPSKYPNKKTQLKTKYTIKKSYFSLNSTNQLSAFTIFQSIKSFDSKHREKCDFATNLKRYHKTEKQTVKERDVTSNKNSFRHKKVSINVPLLPHSGRITRSISRKKSLNESRSKTDFKKKFNDDLEVKVYQEDYEIASKLQQQCLNMKYEFAASKCYFRRKSSQSNAGNIKVNDNSSDKLSTRRRSIRLYWKSLERAKS